MTAKTIEDSCDKYLLARFGKLAPGVEVHVQRDEPWMRDDPDFEPFVMRCPHGVAWRMEPTNDQLLRWREEKAP